MVIIQTVVLWFVPVFRADTDISEEHWRWRHVPPTCRFPPTKLYGVKTQKTTILNYKSFRWSKSLPYCGTTRLITMIKRYPTGQYCKLCHSIAHLIKFILMISYLAFGSQTVSSSSGFQTYILCAFLVCPCVRRVPPALNFFRYPA
jgi:hypothetical protein